MDAQTKRAYEHAAAKWIAQRAPRRIDDGTLARFARDLVPGGLIADLGCGPGWYAQWLQKAGFRVVALDVSGAMLRQARERDGAALLVQGDLASLPLRAARLDGAWAINCYQHLPRVSLPMALARLHWSLRPGAPVQITLARLEVSKATPAQQQWGELQQRYSDDSMRGRLFVHHSPRRAVELFEGAGFGSIEVEAPETEFWMSIRAVRLPSLPDLVGPHLRLLVCGLNPSLFSAARGIAFARPGNRFWPAALAAGLIEREREPLHAFARGIGMTDLVKRATANADEISDDEYKQGLERVERIVRLYRPAATCFVGLSGWRRTINARAQAGWVKGGFGGRPAYLMPSTSGRNARTRLEDLVCHFRAALCP